MPVVQSPIVRLDQDQGLAGFGQLVKALVDLQRRRTPNPALTLPGGAAGTVTFPGGAQSQLSRNEIEQIQGRLGGNIPTTQGQIPLKTGLSSLLPSSEAARFSPPPTLLPEQIQQVIAQNQLANLPLERRQLEATVGKTEAEAEALKRESQSNPLAIIEALRGTPQAPGPEGTGATESQPEGSSFLNDIGITGGNIDPATGKTTLSFGETPEAKERRAQAREQRATQAQVEKDLAKRRRETQEGFRRTSAVFSNLVSQFKAKLEAQGGEGGFVPGILGSIKAMTRQKGSAAIKAADTQRNETALALNNVLTGQNRVIRGVVDMIRETLPGPLDSEEFAAQLTKQSLSNAFRLLLANNKGLLTEDVLDGFKTSTDVKAFLAGTQMTPEEEQFMNDWIQQILSTPAAEQASFESGASDLSDEEQSIVNDLLGGL